MTTFKTDKLRRIVQAAREYHGPHAMHWTPRERAAKVELARRGISA